MNDLTPMIAYVAELTAKPAAADALAQLLDGLVRSTAAEAGARIYVVHQRHDDPARFLVYEAYAGQAAADAHMQSGPVQSALQAFGDLLAEPPVLRHLRARQGFTRAPQGAASGLL